MIAHAKIDFNSSTPNVCHKRQASQLAIDQSTISFDTLFWRVELTTQISYTENFEQRNKPSGRDLFSFEYEFDFEITQLIDLNTSASFKTEKKILFPLLLSDVCNRPIFILTSLKRTIIKCQ